MAGATHTIHIWAFPTTRSKWREDIPRSSPPRGARWRENVKTEVELQHAQPLIAAWQAKLDEVVQTVIDGPVKLVWLVACQHQHEPVVESVCT